MNVHQISHYQYGCFLKWGYHLRMDGLFHRKSHLENGWWLGVPLFWRKNTIWPYINHVNSWTIYPKGMFMDPSWECSSNIPLSIWVFPEITIINHQPSILTIYPIHQPSITIINHISIYFRKPPYPMGMFIKYLISIIPRFQNLSEAPYTATPQGKSRLATCGFTQDFLGSKRASRAGISMGFKMGFNGFWMGFSMCFSMGFKTTILMVVQCCSWVFDGFCGYFEGHSRGKPSKASRIHGTRSPSLGRIASFIKHGWLGNPHINWVSKCEYHPQKMGFSSKPCLNQPSKARYPLVN